MTHKLATASLLTLVLLSLQYTVAMDKASNRSGEGLTKQELLEGRDIKPSCRTISWRLPHINNKWLIGGLAFCTLLSCVHSWSELAVECPYGEHEPSYALEEARAAATNVFNELNMTNCCAAYYNTVRGALQYIVQCAVPESECIAPGSELGL